MKHILISADMEGITGVTCPDDVLDGHPRWEACRRLMASDLNAAIDGFFAAGVETVVVNDAHSTKRNVPLELLDPRASLLIGMHKRLGMMEMIDSGVDAVAFIGYHTAAGRPGVLAHTYISTILLNVTINGVQASEGRMNSMLANELGVPVVLFTGDDLACTEAEEWAPDAERVTVKRCVDRYSAECLPPARTKELIRDAAEKSLAQAHPVTPPSGPFAWEMTFDAVHPVNAATNIPGVEQTGERSVAFTLPTMYESIRCFKTVTSMAKGSAEPKFG